MTVGCTADLPATKAITTYPSQFTISVPLNSTARFFRLTSSKEATGYCRFGPACGTIRPTSMYWPPVVW